MAPASTSLNTELILDDHQLITSANSNGWENKRNNQTDSGHRDQYRVTTDRSAKFLSTVPKNKTRYSLQNLKP